MDDVTLTAFEDELEKIASSAAIIGGGLGALGGAGVGASLAPRGRRLQGALTGAAIGGIGGATLGGVGGILARGKADRAAIRHAANTEISAGRAKTQKFIADTQKEIAARKAHTAQLKQTSEKIKAGPPGGGLWTPETLREGQP